MNFCKKLLTSTSNTVTGNGKEILFLAKRVAESLLLRDMLNMHTDARQNLCQIIYYPDALKNDIMSVCLMIFQSYPQQF